MACRCATECSTRVEETDQFFIEWDAEIEMDDGLKLRADVFRPKGDGRWPVILSHGPYGKGLAFQEGRARQWKALTDAHPDVLEGSTNRYQVWEVADPERFVQDGYVVVRVDSRGAGRSPGFLNPLSSREAEDLCSCIEWAGTAPFSNGRVGLLGVSYHAINQWQAAARRPAHLAAICPWEGGADHYRDLVRHGGILSSFWASWYERRVLPVQHGVGTAGPVSAVTGELVAGPETLSTEELAENRVDLLAAQRAHTLDDDYFAARTPDLTAIDVPMLSAGNWGGHGLHARGNFEGFERASSPDKWLEVHGGAHWEEFSTTYGIELQKAFFGRFLKDEPGFCEGWRAQLQIRHPDRYVIRREAQWPISRTEMRAWHLDAANRQLVTEATATASFVSYASLGPGVTFLGPSCETEYEVTGRPRLSISVSTSASDADLFVVLRLFDATNREVVFRGAQDPHVPVAHGWLRLSTRELDVTASSRRSHVRKFPVTPSEIYALDIELWPTSVVVPPGYRLGLAVRGRDYQFNEPDDAYGIQVELMNGSGRCVHADTFDRDANWLEGTVSIHTGPKVEGTLWLPVVPPI